MAILSYMVSNYSISKMKRNNQMQKVFLFSIQQLKILLTLIKVSSSKLIRKKTYIMIAPNDKERTEWVEALQRNIAKMKKEAERTQKSSSRPTT